MGLFQKSIINKYLKNLDTEKVNKAFEYFKKFFGNKARLANIMQLKEENYQEGFLREIFVQTLGFTINPDENYNLTTEFKNQKDSRKADGAILEWKQGVATPCAVIELKSTKTKDLESIKEQAFGYKVNQPDCKYVITSNFQSLRFYIDNATEYEEFNLFEMGSTKDCNHLFQKFYLLLSCKSILSHLPEKLKQETKFHDEQITAKLYKDYKTFKNRIFDYLVSGNPEYDKLTLFKKSQKLLDRFLFILFAEDSGLIPPNAISKIVEQWKQLQELEKNDTLYSRFQLFFSHLDKGHIYKQWGEIPAYNGGLFRYDEILDNPNLKLPDGLLQNNLPVLSAYDFGSDVDVNILGHIFEHSLSEIEEMEQEITSQKFETFETLKISKRKKDGIFYTPKYITKYIVENTVGALCNEKKTELQIKGLLIDDTYYNKTNKGLQPLAQKGKDLFETLQAYKNWLLTLKILDPACGSGAFLNATLDFLIAEHNEIDNLISELTGDKMRIFDTDKQILENNIYGVDINEESVEIAKLSLWLRTAQRGRTLSDLSGNIKCGNSLIDNPEVAGEKAFDWEKEFPHIFNPQVKEKVYQKLPESKPDYAKLIKEKAKKAEDLAKEALEISKQVYEYAEKINVANEPIAPYGIKKGGFDVVLGNPPYVRQENINKTEKDYLSKHYEVGNGIADLYIYFYNLGINLLKQNGILGYITPNKWFKAKYGFNLRNFIKQFHIIEINDFFELRIFQDASTEPQIIIIQNNKSSANFNYYPISSTAQFIAAQVKPSVIEKNNLNSDSWILAKNNNNAILEKIYRNTISLIEYTNNGIEYGIKTGLNKAFIINEATKDKLLKEDPRSAELIKKYVSGTDIEKWNLKTREKQFFINTYYDIDIEEYSAVYKYLLQFNNELEKRQDKGKSHFNLRACSYYEKFETPKILYIHTAVNHKFYYDTENYYINNSCYFITNADKFIACWLNSRIFDYLKRLIFVAYGDATDKGRAKLDYNKMVNIPIPKLTEPEKQPFYEKADQMLFLNKQLQTEKQNFINTLKEEKHLEKITKTLENFNDLDFEGLKKEIGKQKARFVLGQETNEWREYFNTAKQKANELQSQINQTDKEIDRMVYELYELTEEEIEIVENATK